MILVEQRYQLLESFDASRPPEKDRIALSVWEWLDSLPHESGYPNLLWALFQKDRAALGRSELKSVYADQLNNLKDNLDQYDMYKKTLLGRGIRQVKVNGIAFRLENNACLTKLRSAKGLNALVDAMYEATLDGDVEQDSDFDESYEMTSKDLENIRIIGYTADLVCFATRTFESTNKFIYRLWRCSNMNTPHGNTHDDSACKVNSPFCTRMGKHWTTYSHYDPDYEQFWFFLKPDGKCSATGPLSDPECAKVCRKMSKRGYELLVGLDDTYGNANDRFDAEIRHDTGDGSSKDLFGRENVQPRKDGEEAAPRVSKKFKMFDKSGKDLTDQVISMYGPVLKIGKTLDFPVISAKIFSYQPKNMLTPEQEERIKRAVSGPVVRIPDGVESVASKGFHGSKELEKIIFPASVKKINNYAFMGCRNLAKAVFSEGLQELLDRAFDQSALRSVEVPASVEKLGDSVFYNCPCLNYASIKCPVGEIPYEMFCSCGSLKRVELPESVRSIREKAFQECGSLREIKLPPKLETIAGVAFMWSGLRHVDIPETVRTIGSGAFSDCPDLEYAYVPNSLDTAGGYIFHKCEKLAAVRVMGLLGEHMFEECSSLKNVDLSEDIKVVKKYAFRKCTALEHIKLPRFLQWIGEKAFEGCTSLKEIEIPKNVETVGVGAFSGCSKLKRIIMDSTNVNSYSPSKNIAEGCPLAEFVVRDREAAAWAEASGVPKDKIRVQTLDESRIEKQKRKYSRMFLESFWR